MDVVKFSVSTAGLCSFKTKYQAFLPPYIRANLQHPSSTCLPSLQICQAIAHPSSWAETKASDGYHEWVICFSHFISASWGQLIASTYSNGQGDVMLKKKKQQTRCSGWWGYATKRSSSPQTKLTPAYSLSVQCALQQTEPKRYQMRQAKTQHAKCHIGSSETYKPRPCRIPFHWKSRQTRSQTNKANADQRCNHICWALPKRLYPGIRRREEKVIRFRLEKRHKSPSHAKIESTSFSDLRPTTLSACGISEPPLMRLEGLGNIFGWCCQEMIWVAWGLKVCRCVAAEIV
jgi:hypothetical protein